jgi:hypothetical protein
MASLSKIIDVHSHIITNLGSQSPMDKLPPWSIELREQKRRPSE